MMLAHVLTRTLMLLSTLESHTIVKGYNLLKHLEKAIGKSAKFGTLSADGAGSVTHCKN
jgi:hypothetical protein